VINRYRVLKQSILTPSIKSLKTVNSTYNKQLDVFKTDPRLSCIEKRLLESADVSQRQVENHLDRNDEPIINIYS